MQRSLIQNILNSVVWKDFYSHIDELAKPYKESLPGYSQLNLSHLACYVLAAHLSNTYRFDLYEVTDTKYVAISCEDFAQKCLIKISTSAEILYIDPTSLGNTILVLNESELQEHYGVSSDELREVPGLDGEITRYLTDRSMLSVK